MVEVEIWHHFWELWLVQMVEVVICHHFWNCWEVQMVEVETWHHSWLLSVVLTHLSLLEFGINGGIEEALAELETLESEFDAMVEEFLAEVEAEFAGFEGPLDIPLQCDCVPSEVVTLG